MDTNTVSDYFSAKLSTGGLSFIDALVDAGPRLSVISRIELLGYNAPIVALFRDFVAIALVYDIDEAIVDRTIALRKARRIKIPDAIIAATALVHDLTLVTHNRIDFEGISGLRMIDAHTFS